MVIDYIVLTGRRKCVKILLGKRPMEPTQLPLFIAPETPKITHIIKRDGRLMPFDKSKITHAIFRAALSVGGVDKDMAERLAGRVLKSLCEIYPAGAAPSVEEIQDLVEKVLMEGRHIKTAKAYILYRAERRRLRQKRDERIEVEDNIPYKVLWKVHTWNVDHKCHTLQHLNRHLERGTWPGLVAGAEKTYHDEIAKVAAAILRRRELRLVIVAGPSSSGKTTTTTKIGERLSGEGLRFKTMNLDHYFKNLEEHPKDEYGDYDFERPEALDLPLINEHLGELMKGRAIQMPLYSFKTGKREKETRGFALDRDELLLIDSLHGLYGPMTQSVPPEVQFRFYIEAMCQVKDDRGEFVRWADLRMLRRMIRDSWHRSYDPVATVGHWHYVRRSEMRYIVPFIHSADYVFNGALPYELPYYKKYLYPNFGALLDAFRNDPKKTDAYLRAQRVYEMLRSLRTPADDADVPKNSLLREFIGGSGYNY